MKNSTTNARNVASSSTHRFPWKWNLSDLDKVEKNGLNVFSTFSCGGGSSMGYKLAGFNVIGNCEIDEAVIKIYRQNLHPKYSYLMDVRDFLKIPMEELPEELKHLDVLDGSPPCSTFSMAGAREDGWGVEKKFREGQEKQRLDDLFFWFIKIADKLQPKVVIAENVEGLIHGNAKGYVNEIVKAYDKAGYVVQLFFLNSATMGVPQARRRVFFVAHRKDLAYPKLKLEFNEKPILFGEVRSEKGKSIGIDTLTAKRLSKRRKGDIKLSMITKRTEGVEKCFTQMIIDDDMVAPTITSGGNQYRFCDAMLLSKQDYVSVQSFPQDYDFGTQPAQYVCGMSVPPVMMAQIASAVYEQWLR